MAKGEAAPTSTSLATFLPYTCESGNKTREHCCCESLRPLTRSVLHSQGSEGGSSRRGLVLLFKSVLNASSLLELLPSRALTVRGSEKHSLER